MTARNRDALLTPLSRPPSQQNLERQGEQRGSRRLKVFIPAYLRPSQGSGRCHVLNLSVSGLMIHAPGLDATLSTIWIEFGGRQVSGSVAWRSGSRAGVRFCNVLQDAEVNALLGVAPRPA